MNDNILFPKLDAYKTHTRINPMSGLLDRTPIIGAKSYYRSRTFTPQISINPLIGAASSLIKINSELSKLNEYNDIAKLYESLVHEINAFETSAQNNGVRADTILVARFVLCSFLDETILNTQWGKHSHWQQCKLLYTFQRENNSDERFFLILDRVSEEPAQHIDLLELMYLCLSLGFEGKFRHQKRGMVELDKIIDSLYQQIRSQRLTQPPLLAATPATAAIERKAHKKNLWPNLWKVIIVGIVLISATFLGLNYALNTAVHPIAEQLQQINHANTN